LELNKAPEQLVEPATQGSLLLPAVKYLKKQVIPEEHWSFISGQGRLPGISISEKY